MLRMRHPSYQTGDNEFSLESALEVRCMNATNIAACGECETCLTLQKVRDFREWFFRFGDYSKKHFMLGLVQRINNKALLKNLVLLLQPTATKDCIYARARTNPSLETDQATVSSDRAISPSRTDHIITSTWDWFTSASYFTKLNFTLSLLQMCDAHLLHILYRHANTLLSVDLKTIDVLSEDETLLTSSGYSHLSNDRELLSSKSSTGSSRAIKNNSTGQVIIGQSFTDFSSLSDASSSSFDPMIQVIHTLENTYAGVTKYKDFIRCLPVHLSKLILSMLDMASLYNALCVSPNWRKLAEEVRFEIGVNQQVKEEVMLMQGAAAQSANPVYAKDIDVLVPNLEPGTHNVIYTSDDIIKTTFKSEHCFKTAYSGVSTSKVIMEERNIYCGTYNVLVVVDKEDSHRVMHTDGSNRVALGSKDRKVRFVDCETARETGPIITGHAGSVTCCYLLYDREMVLSGSYDTSIRCWSTTTGKCLKIMRGHQDTVNCITVQADMVATGAMDKTCKIWSLESGKCQQTFKHRSSVLAVALSKELCLSGGESGKVKVWELRSGNLIKMLTGHHASVMSIKFDRWHIVTGSKDGYVLVWSTVGRHSRCLTALRHPKEVLCLEFAYLRVVTGSADGRIRIWNILTGQCCRIMRGNSQSDPILSIVAIGDRITVNTLNSLLVMNFEKIDLDYTLETDKVSSLVKYASYSDAPFRCQPYPYVRAQRMRKVGASNYRIVHHSTPLPDDNTGHAHLPHEFRALQLSHSTRSLSSKSLLNAKRVQGSLKSFDMSLTADTSSRASHSRGQQSVVDQFSESPERKTYSAQSTGKSNPRNKSASSQFNVSIEKQPDDDHKDIVREATHISRRISWAFEKPLVSSGKDVSLSEMKALLRSQIRMKAENIVPPDFIYLTVSSIQKSMIKSETNNNTIMNKLGWKPNSVSRKKRPTSSPSRIDSRTKVPWTELGIQALRNEDRAVSQLSNLSCASLPKTKEECNPEQLPRNESYITACTATTFNTLSTASVHPDSVKTTIPQGQIIRPVSAGPAAHKVKQAPLETLPPRPSTTPNKLCSMRLKTIPESITPSLPGASSTSKKSRSDLQTSSSEQASHVTMLMYIREAKEKIAQLKMKRKIRQAQEEGHTAGEAADLYPNPFRDQTKFQLLTHQQEEDYLLKTELLHADHRRTETEKLEKKRKRAWLRLATGQPDKLTDLQVSIKAEPVD